jgi:hypothetical protein
MCEVVLRHGALSRDAPGGRSSGLGRGRLRIPPAGARRPGGALKRGAAHVTRRTAPKQRIATSSSVLAASSIIPQAPPASPAESAPEIVSPQSVRRPIPLGKPATPEAQAGLDARARCDVPATFVSSISASMPSRNLTSRTSSAVSHRVTYLRFSHRFPRAIDILILVRQVNISRYERIGCDRIRLDFR